MATHDNAGPEYACRGIAWDVQEPPGTIPGLQGKIPLR